MALGRKTGGRKKGTPNRLAGDRGVDIRAFYMDLLEGNAQHLQTALDDLRLGQVIERKLEDGSIISGHLNADPKGYVDSLAKLAKFCLPELARHTVEGVGEGGAIVVKVDRKE
jgi:hypothetical protein